MTNNIGIDLGTANTLVFVAGKGIIINEPSIVAINKKTNRVLAVGNEAKEMYGKTPSHISVIRPLVDGVISDYEVTEEMLHYLIKKTDKSTSSLFGMRPRVVIGVPSGVTNVESRAVVDAAKSAGAREVYIIEEPMAAAIGVGLPVTAPVGSMIIDMGGGTVDIATISYGGIVQSKNLKVAGDRLNSDIMTYLRNEHRLLIGERTAEAIKMELGSAVVLDERFMNVKGQDLVTGLPRSLLLSDADIREAILPSIRSLVEGVKEVLENTPPEVLSDIMKTGIFLSGGGALIKGLDQFIEKEVELKVTIASDPLTAVARGAGTVLEDLDLYMDMLIYEDDELPRR